MDAASTALDTTTGLDATSAVVDSWATSTADTDANAGLGASADDAP